MTNPRFLVRLDLTWPAQCDNCTSFHSHFREAAAQVTPTASTGSSKDINHHGPTCNNTAKIPQNNWTFNKTLSNLIRQAAHSPQIPQPSHTAASLKSVLIYIYIYKHALYMFSGGAGRASWDSWIRRETSPFWRARWNQGTSSTTSLIATAPQTSLRISTVSCQPRPRWRTSTTGAAPSWATLASCWTAAAAPRSTHTTLSSGFLFYVPLPTPRKQRE